MAQYLRPEADITTTGIAGGTYAAMENKIDWKIYYADGSTFDSLQGSPQDAPSIGVICLKHFTLDNKWELLAYRDYYIYDRQWWGGDSAGFWQYMFKTGLKIVKFGTSTTDFEFERILATAREDNIGEGSIIT